MDTFRIDSHKLVHHLDRLHDWSKGIDIYPVYMEISPAGSCNHRCIFCALDYLEYKPRFLETGVLTKCIADAAAKGLKSVMFAGEGEPLLHKDITRIVAFCSRKKVDTAITTNGVLLTEKIAPALLKHLSWLRVSFNGATAASYARIHRTKPEDFTRVGANLTRAIRIRDRERYRCTIGAQFLLIEENFNEVIRMASLAERIGLDYLIIKPYSQHPLSKNRLGGKLDYRALLGIEKKLARFTKGRCEIVFRAHTMTKLHEKKPYGKCLGLPFWAYLNTDGDIYGCSCFLGDERFRYGNIYRTSFESIWKGKRRMAFNTMMRTRWDIGRCRQACRMDEINRFLWELKNPPAHVNFI
ncbi:MAG: radical SAM protein [Candidatus Omnitrophota bacterium]